MPDGTIGSSIELHSWEKCGHKPGPECVSSPGSQCSRGPSPCVQTNRNVYENCRISSPERKSDMLRAINENALTAACVRFSEYMYFTWSLPDVADRILSYDGRNQIFHLFVAVIPGTGMFQSLYYCINCSSSFQTWKFNGFKYGKIGVHSLYLTNSTVEPSDTFKERFIWMQEFLILFRV
jgi:hypothetical protein